MFYLRGIHIDILVPILDSYPAEPGCINLSALTRLERHVDV